MPTQPDAVDPRVARTRDAVVAAVRDLVRTAGIEAVTHQRVAEAAGVGRASVYRHWPDRTHLLLDALADLPADPSERPPSGDPVADVVAELTRLQRILNDSPFVPQLAALLSQAEADGEVLALQQRLLTQGTARLRAAVELGVRHGCFPAGVDPGTVVALVAGPLFYRRLLAKEPITDELVTTVVERLVVPGNGPVPAVGERAVPGG